MDHLASKETDTVIDIESCDNTVKVGIPSPSDDKIGNIASFTTDRTVMVGKSFDHSCNQKTLDELSLEPGNNNKRENRKSMSAKKPPRPPRGLSLDAADQKLIKEITELAMIKRARIERIKALKKMKEAKASSVSSSSSGNLIAILLTVLFCIVVIFQGCQPSGSSTGNKSAIPTPSSLEPNGVVKGNNVVVHDFLDSGTSAVPLTSVKSSMIVELGPGSDTKG